MITIQSSIVINIGDNKIELTIGQAKELQALLNDTFGKAEPKEPIWIEPYQPSCSPWIVTSGTTSGSTIKLDPEMFNASSESVVFMWQRGW